MAPLSGDINRNWAVNWCNWSFVLVWSTYTLMTHPIQLYPMPTKRRMMVVLLSPCPCGGHGTGQTPGTWRQMRDWLANKILVHSDSVKCFLIIYNYFCLNICICNRISFFEPSLSSLAMVDEIQQTHPIVGKIGRPVFGPHMNFSSTDYHPWLAML